MRGVKVSVEQIVARKEKGALDKKIEKRVES